MTPDYDVVVHFYFSTREECALRDGEASITSDVQIVSKQTDVYQLPANFRAITNVSDVWDGRMENSTALSIHRNREGKTGSTKYHDSLIRHQVLKHPRTLDSRLN